MKVDKVIWSSSVEYSDFWNINSLIHNKFLDLDCVLLLYGKKDGFNLSEDYGEIIECDFDSSAPDIPQLIFNKWHYTRNEPNTTWLIGDIDQVPLQKEHFIDQLHDVPEDAYVHLVEDATTFYGCPDWKKEKGSLPGHYHVAKGSTFIKALDLEKDLCEHTNNLIKNAQDDGSPVWAYEEVYTADLIKLNYFNNFHGFSRGKFENCSIDHGPLGKKICRSQGSAYDLDLLKNNKYVDYHCPRPYKEHKDFINSVLKLAWGEL